MNAIKLYNKEKDTVTTIKTETTSINQTYLLKEGANLKIVGTLTENIRLRVGPNSRFKNLKDAILYSVEYNRTNRYIYIDIEDSYVWEELELIGLDLHNIVIIPPSNYLDVKEDARFCINFLAVRNFTLNNLKIDLKRRTKKGTYPYFRFTEESTAQFKYLDIKGEIDATAGLSNDVSFITVSEKSSLYAGFMNLDIKINITDRDDYIGSQAFFQNVISSKLYLNDSNIKVSINRTGTTRYRLTRFMHTDVLSHSRFYQTNFTFSSNKEEYTAINSTRYSDVFLHSCVLNLQKYIGNSAIKAHYGGRLVGENSIINIRDASIVPIEVLYSGYISNIRKMTFNPIPSKYGNIDIDTNTTYGVIYS